MGDFCESLRLLGVHLFLDRALVLTKCPLQRLQPTLNPKPWRGVDSSDMGGLGILLVHHSSHERLLPLYLSCIYPWITSRIASLPNDTIRICKILRRRKTIKSTQDYNSAIIVITNAAATTVTIIRMILCGFVIVLTNLAQFVFMMIILVIVSIHSYYRGLNN